MEQLFKMLDSIEDLDLRLDILEEIILEFDNEDRFNFIKMYIKYEKKIVSQLFAIKNKLNNSGNYEDASKVQRQIKRINRYIDNVRKLKCRKEKDCSDISTNNIVVNNVKRNENLELSRDSIMSLDEFCDMKFTKNLELVKVNPFDLELLEKIKLDCINCNRFLKKSGRIARENEDLELVNKIKTLKKVKGLILNHVNNLIYRCNVYNSKLEKKEETYEDVFGENEKLSKEQINFIEAIINGKCVEINNNIVDYVIALKEIIKKHSFLENEGQIIKSIRMITELPIESTLQDYLYTSIISALKTKRKSYEKCEKFEKRKIDILIEYLEDQILYHDNAFIDDRTVLNYDILDYAIHRQVPYYYLKQIVKQHKDAILFEKNGESLLIKILENYIESQKIELRNHKHDYIKKEYYKNFYHLMIKYMDGEISDELQEKINVISNNFKEYMNLSGYKSENKSEALTSFDRLLNPVTDSVYSTITEEDILKAQENLKNYTHYLINSKDRVIQDFEYLEKLQSKISDFQEKFYEDYGKYPNNSFVSDMLEIPYYDYMDAYYNLSTVTFNHGNLSFSILDDKEGSTYFRINVLDLSSYVSEGDLLNTYLKENMGRTLKNSKTFSDNYSIPSVTYQIKIYPNGSVGSLKIFKSVTKVDYNYQSLENYREDNTLKKFVAVYKKMSKNNDVPNSTLELEQFFKDYITEIVKNICLKEDIPLIMKGKKSVDVDTLMKIQSDLGPVFSKMEKEQFFSYYNIFKENLNAPHYVCSQYDDGDYSLKLDNPSSYIDLFNQRLLLKLEKLFMDNTSINILEEEACEVCLEANKQIGYIQEESKKKKNKCKRKSFNL